MNITKTPLEGNIVSFIMIAEDTEEQEFLNKLLKTGLPVISYSKEMIQFKIDTSGTIIPRMNNPLDEL